MTLVNATTGEILADLTPAEARDLTEMIKATTETVWALLRDSYQRGAWSALGYSSWREYATTEFGMSQSRAYQLLDQAKVIAELEAASSTDVEITEAQARDLKPVLAEAVAAVKQATEEPATEEEKQERVRAALDNLRTSMVEKQRPQQQRQAAALPPRPVLSEEEQYEADLLEADKRSARALETLTDVWPYFRSYHSGERRERVSKHLVQVTVDALNEIEEMLK